MKKAFYTVMLAMAATALASCGDGSDDVYPSGDEIRKQSETASDLPAEEPEPPRTMTQEAGRWTTAKGSVGDGQHLVVDLTSTGRFTIDVVASGPEGNEIVETGSGVSQAKGNRIFGVIEDGPDVHGVLGALKQWTIDHSGEGPVLVAEGIEPIRIKKHEF